jgi:hypothetical protein
MFISGLALFMFINYPASINNTLYLGIKLRNMPVSLEFDDWIFVVASSGN